MLSVDQIDVKVASVLQDAGLVDSLIAGNPQRSKDDHDL